MSSFDDNDIRRALQTVIDPEVGFDIWMLGLIYSVDHNGDDVEITMTLTTRGCPMEEYLTSEVKKALGAIEGVGEVRINLVFDPPWNPGMIDQEGLARLRGNQ